MTSVSKMRLAVSTVLGKYASFTGRASRPEFWWWVLAVFLLMIVTQIIDALIIAPLLGVPASGENASQVLSFFVALAVLLPNIAVGARRLHDTGRTAWWLLLAFIPLLGFLVLLWFYTRPSEPENQWGPPNPLY